MHHHKECGLVRVMLATLVLVGIFLAPNFFRENWQAEAVAVEESQISEPRLVAAMFRSSWCSSCRIIEPRIEDVKDDYEDAAVDFIRFDFTLGRRAHLRERAVEEGIVELYDHMVGRTGFMVLMDRETGTVFEIVTMAYDRQHIREALDRWIAVTTQAEPA
jgi:thiol-disulfide isomerase/thioredoxin